MQDTHGETTRDLAAAVAMIQKIDAVPELLESLCALSGMGFSFIARVTEESWIACAVQDEIDYGLLVGQQLDVGTTFCREVRACRHAIVIDRASTDYRYQDHLTPKIYGFESYISVPIILANGAYFGNLCAVDPNPAALENGPVEMMFHTMARLIARQIDTHGARRTQRQAALDRKLIGNVRGLFAMLVSDRGERPRDVAVGARRLHSSWGPELSRLAARLAARHDPPERLVDAVLRYARNSASGGLSHRVSEVPDLGAGLTRIVAEAKAAHPGRLVISNITVSQMLYCDEARIQQLSANLLSNALTHGLTRGPVSFVASLAAETLTISVWNDGHVLSPASLACLFEPFWQRRSDPPPFALGLYLSGEIVRAHHGKIKATSSAAQGTHLVVKLPTRRPPRSVACH